MPFERRRSTSSFRATKNRQEDIDRSHRIESERSSPTRHAQLFRRAAAVVDIVAYCVTVSPPSALTFQAYRYPCFEMSSTAAMEASTTAEGAFESSLCGWNCSLAAAA